MILSICSETVRLVYLFSLLIFAGVAVGLRQQLQILLSNPACKGLYSKILVTL